MVDGVAVTLVILDVADVVEGVAVKELGPEAVGDCTCDAPAFADLRKHIRLRQAKHVAIARAAMLGRSHAGVYRRIAGGRD